MQAADCPRCQVPLQRRAEDNSSFECASCGGLLVTPSVLQQKLLTDTVSTEASSSELADALRCPKCATSMSVFRLGAFEIDRCQTCGGIWFDRGESLPAVDQPASSDSVGNMLLYSLSLPERVLRSTVGVAAGTAKEISSLIVPQAFRDSKTYGVVVNSSLQFLTEDVGGVARDKSADQPADDFVARKVVGNFVDMAGLATLHVSPLWVLAIVSDVAYGTRTYLSELGDELKKQGLIDENSTIHHADDVLNAVAKASSRSASLFDTPPLSVDELRETLKQTRDATAAADLRKIIPEAELRQYWDEMRSVAEQNNVSLLGVSAALTMHSLGKVKNVSTGALTGVQVAGGMFQRHIIGHYQASLDEMRREGFYTFLQNSSAPYVEAVWQNFSRERDTWTQSLLSGRAVSQAFGIVRKWFGMGKQAGSPAAET